MVEENAKHVIFIIIHLLDKFKIWFTISYLIVSAPSSKNSAKRPWIVNSIRTRKVRLKSNCRLPNITEFYCLVTQLHPTLCNPMDCSTPSFPVLHHLPEFAHIHIHWVSDAIQPSHALLSPSPPVLNLSQCQGLFQWVGSSHQVVKVLELQLQHQSFQWKSWSLQIIKLGLEPTHFF